MTEDIIFTGDVLIHLPTGERGIYVEHVNEGEGRIVRLKSGKTVIGPYSDFKKDHS